MEVREEIVGKGRECERWGTETERIRRQRGRERATEERDGEVVKERSGAKRQRPRAWGEGLPRPPLLTSLSSCRPHTVDAGACAAVAGVGNKGIRLDGDRHVLFSEHGRQGAMQNEQGGLSARHLRLQHGSSVVTPQLPQGK